MKKPKSWTPSFSKLTYSLIAKLSKRAKTKYLSIWLVKVLLKLEIFLKLYPFKWSNATNTLSKSKKCNGIWIYLHWAMLLVVTCVKIYIFAVNISLQARKFNIIAITEFLMCLVQIAAIINGFYLAFINPHNCMLEINHWLLLTASKFK